MGEIRIVGPGKTRGYPYSVCKEEFSSNAKNRTKSVPYLQIHIYKKVFSSYKKLLFFISDSFLLLPTVFFLSIID